jgi:hypothetical protein
MVLRLAEIYLTRAEARARQGNVAGAVADLNVIRVRAGLPGYSGLTDQNSLIGAIIHERQVELFAEGDRWITLKRTQTINDVMGGPTGVCAAKGGSWTPDWALYPLPFNDVSRSGTLVQNPGY